MFLYERLSLVGTTERTLYTAFTFFLHSLFIAREVRNATKHPVYTEMFSVTSAESRLATGLTS